MEVHEQSHLLSSLFAVCPDLSMDLPFNALDFHNDRVFRKEVETIRAGYLSLVQYRKRDLPPISQPRIRELPTERLFRGCSQQTRPEVTVNLDGATCDRFGQFV